MIPIIILVIIGLVVVVSTVVIITLVTKKKNNTTTPSPTQSSSTPIPVKTFFTYPRIPTDLNNSLTTVAIGQDPSGDFTIILNGNNTGMTLGRMGNENKFYFYLLTDYWNINTPTANNEILFVRVMPQPPQQSTWYFSIDNPSNDNLSFVMRLHTDNNSDPTYYLSVPVFNNSLTITTDFASAGIFQFFKYPTGQWTYSELME